MTNISIAQDTITSLKASTALKNKVQTLDLFVQVAEVYIAQGLTQEGADVLAYVLQYEQTPDDIFDMAEDLWEDLACWICPRVLLDAAGFVTAVDAMSDAGADIAVQQAQDAAQALFAAPMTELTDRHAEESDPAYQLIQSLTGPKDIQDTDSVNEDGIKSIVYEPIEDITALNDAPQPEGIPDKSIVYEPFTGEEMEEGAGALAFERSAIDPRFDFADSPDAQAMTSRFTAEHYDTLSEDTALDADDIIDGRAYQSNAGIVFVDTAVADYQDILDGLDPSLEVVLI